MPKEPLQNPSAVSAYWPKAHHFNANGTLSITVSWEDDGHAKGERTIAMTHPDYLLWVWLVRLPTAPEIIHEPELEALRQVFHTA